MTLFISFLFVNLRKVLYKMTLEEYYKAEEKIRENEPQNISLGEAMAYYKKEKEKLRSQLSPEVLEKVLKNERRFYDKMQSGIS